ncbi:MAG: hypothetical protein FWF12_06775 [Betaproteobacteria bacterium]|nr:hypothetical protein [Betaproteobacteria bacterium]
MSSQDGNQPYDPYTPTANAELVPANAEPVPAKEGNFIPGGRPVSVIDGIDWVSSAWNLFKRQPKRWVLIVLKALLILIAVDLLQRFVLVRLNSNVQGVLQIILFILFQVITILLPAGVVYYCDRLQREGLFSFIDLFAAFGRRAGPFIKICLLLLCLTLVQIIFILLILFFVLGAGNVFSFSSLSLAPMHMGGMILLFYFGVFVALISEAILVMAMWFAPALAMMHDLSALEAMKMSFYACRKNILPGIVFFVVMIGMAFICIITFGLGLLIAVPMFFICYYTTYRSVFFDENSGRY